MVIPVRAASTQPRDRSREGQHSAVGGIAYPLMRKVRMKSAATSDSASPSATRRLSSVIRFCDNGAKISATRSSQASGARSYRAVGMFNETL